MRFLRRAIAIGSGGLALLAYGQGGWGLTNVGDPAPTPAASWQWTGESSAAITAVTITGGGAGIGGVDLNFPGAPPRVSAYYATGVEDSFGYMLRSATGNEELIARLVRLDGPTGAQAAILVRGPAVQDQTIRPPESQLFTSLVYRQGEGLATLARFQVNNGMIYGDSPGEAYPRVVDPAPTLPLWLRLQHTAHGALLSTSSDGTTWTPRDWRTLPTTWSTLGFGVSGGKDGVAATATFDNIRVGPLSSPIPAPNAPANLRAGSVASSVVSLRWDEDPVGYDDVEIERATDAGPFVRVLELNDSTVAANTTYHYRVRLVRNSAASPWSSTLTVTTPFIAAPSGLTADTSIPNQVTLHWTDNSPDETQFIIEERITDYPFTQTAPADATSATIKSLSDNVTYYFRVRSTKPDASSAWSNEVAVRFGLSPTGGPTITTQPTATHAQMGAAATFFSSAATAPGASYAWQVDGKPLPSVGESSLTLTDLQPANAGLYQVIVSDSGGSARSQFALLGLQTPLKITGGGTEVGSDIRHPNGNIYDQVLMTSDAVTVTANPGQVVRVSFVDLSDDIVQVEFSGAGTLTIKLDAASGPLPAVNYRQPDVAYMKGHAGIVISGSNTTTNLSVFSVGRITAVNQSLFRDDVRYDGVADLAYIAIDSPGAFGGLRAANASFWATRGITGVYAPAATFSGPVYVCDITATEDATPVLLARWATDVRITGGDQAQTNGRPVMAAGYSQLVFTDGATSHGERLPALANQARFVDGNGQEITSQITVQQQ